MKKLAMGFAPLVMALLSCGKDDLKGWPLFVFAAFLIVGGVVYRECEGHKSSN